MTRLIHFIRHGDVLSKDDHRYVGTTDLSLTEDGRAAVDALRGAISGLKVSHVLCSPMARTRQTCERLFASRDATIEPALREIDFGDWENLSFDEISERDPSLVNEWAERGEAFRFPNGEPFSAFRTRVCECLDALVAGPEGDLAMVTHGGVIRAAICHLLRLPSSAFLSFDVSPASVTTIQAFNEGGLLKRLNFKPEVD